jgi:hypothetical protein
MGGGGRGLISSSLPPLTSETREEMSSCPSLAHNRVLYTPYRTSCYSLLASLYPPLFPMKGGGREGGREEDGEGGGNKKEGKGGK